MMSPKRIAAQLVGYENQWSRSSGMRGYSKSSRWKRKGDIEALEWVLHADPNEEGLRERIAELREKLKTRQFPTMRYKTKGWIRALKWVLR